MLIAAAAAGAASLLHDALSSRRPAAAPARPDAAEAPQPARPQADKALTPAAAKLVADMRAMLLGVQAGAG